MAPPPEYDQEPKAPDKCLVTLNNEDPKSTQNEVQDYISVAENKRSNPIGNDSENKHIENLDDEKLRALLDEAITYKCPKDREGKSSLFKELLEEVEQDEQAIEAAARGGGVCGGGGGVRRRGGTGGRRGGALPHSNSLQDLVAALAAEPHRHARHTRQPPPAPPVSARAIHGGSLPSGVDTSFLLGEESGREYVATVRCVNPSPLERRVSGSDALPNESDLPPRRSKPTFPMTYTARATLEIGSGSVGSGRAVTTTTASNQVDSGIPFSCITTPEVVASCNTTSSTSQSAISVDSKPRSVSALNGLPLSRPNYGSTATTSTDDYKKSLDENGNSVQGFSSPPSGSSQHKKPRRKKSSKNETVIKSHQIDGYQGNKDLNELLKFIESNEDTGRTQKLGRSKHKDDSDDKGSKKRSTERRKDKDSGKIKRASSLEELSRTKLEDLTDKPETVLRSAGKDPWADGAPSKSERRSWGDDARGYFRERNSESTSAEHDITGAAELTDFQTVTKKRKPRRRADEFDREAAAGDATIRRARAPSLRRRPSAPPSDRSNDSNDESNHELALSPPAPPPAALPHASYADIARTRQNIPDLIESCNYYAEGTRTEPAPSPGDASGYPALRARRRTAPVSSATPISAVHAEPIKKERPHSPAHQVAPDVVRRPAVILAARGAAASLDGVTFGFDVNEQLLRRPVATVARAKCDLVLAHNTHNLQSRKDDDTLASESVTNISSESVEIASDECPTNVDLTVGVGVELPADVADETLGIGVGLSEGVTALRFLPPDHKHDHQHLSQIVNYVYTAWEDVVRCKVLYFNE